MAEQNKEDSLLKYFSHECWKYFGEFSKQNLFSAFSKQSELILESVDIFLKDAWRHKKNTIIEGIHLLPSLIAKRKELFPELKIVNLFITTEYDFFEKILLTNRTVSTYRHRKIEDYDENRLSIYNNFLEMWSLELKKYDIQYIVNDSDTKTLIAKTLNQLLCELKC